MGPLPSLHKTLLNGFAQISGGVWTEVGGSGPTHSPCGDATDYSGSFEDLWVHMAQHKNCVEKVEPKKTLGILISTLRKTVAGWSRSKLLSFITEDYKTFFSMLKILYTDMVNDEFL